MTDIIQIERLTTGTLIYVETLRWHTLASTFNGCGYVTDIEFDGEGYAVTFEDRGREFDTYIPAGGSVEYGGRGVPSLRSDAEINRAEWEAKTAACDRAIAASIAELNARANGWRDLADALDSVREGSDYQMEAAQ